MLGLLEVLPSAASSKLMSELTLQPVNLDVVDVEAVFVDTDPRLTSLLIQASSHIGYPEWVLLFPHGLSSQQEELLEDCLAKSRSHSVRCSSAALFRDTSRKSANHSKSCSVARTDSPAHGSPSKQTPSAEVRSSAATAPLSLSDDTKPRPNMDKSEKTVSNISLLDSASTKGSCPAAWQSSMASSRRYVLWITALVALCASSFGNWISSSLS
mmetsp:Transcript_70291/g.132649  ORF Transcript_70291/g.132649 Transcript_70291/m.132649 type:complete len:213 (+) Transcript_70291:338-976(+)